jgi:hypothetical protein
MGSAGKVFDAVNSAAAVIAALQRAPDVVVPLIREIPPDILKRRSVPRRWSAHEHACHLPHVHALFFDRLDYMLRNPAPLLRPYLPGEQDADDLLLRMDIDDCLDRYASDRARLVARLETLAAGGWARTAEHAEDRSCTTSFTPIASKSFFFRRHWPAETGAP